MELHGGFRQPSISNEMYLKYGEIRKREEKEKLLLESMQNGRPPPSCSKGTQNREMPLGKTDRLILPL